MTVPTGLNHVAMSVPAGTLTEAYRTELLSFYGELLGWREIESLRLPDRLTISVGRHTYVNLRERPAVMVCTGYEHLGVVAGSSEDVEHVWDLLAAERREVHLEALERGEDGFRSLRFRYLLPLTVEVQYFP